ncbi:MAG: indole-3-glycerol phosphate synthase TrpC [Clostridiales bacterium]|nr:indole-3-glycerol phosphate synthase TrpC [Clostridiales bacterium]
MSEAITSVDKVELPDSNILRQITAHAKERVALAKNSASLSQIRQRALDLPTGDFAFEQAIGKAGLSFICEMKKASPSKGVIAQDFPYLRIAGEYESAFADAISVLTEPKWFLGNAEILAQVSAAVNIPTLRKDFIVDEYQIYEAKTLGTSAVLLIVSILAQNQLFEYINVARELGLSALVEAHDAKEIEAAIDAGARMIGVNNRNLKDFTVDTRNSANLRRHIPPGVLFVAESGIKTPEDIRAMLKINADAVLIGEAMMKAADKTGFLSTLRNSALRND